VENKKNLVVTLADQNFLPQAKQLFSSVYWNAGWNGDFLLLAHEVPDEKLEWFRNKGIHIKKCTAIHNQSIGFNQHPPVVLDKLLLFSPEFKQWGRIIFFDADIIVKGSLDKLAKVNGFGAVSSNLNLKKQFFSQNALYGEIKENYDVGKESFTSGMFAFPTDIIRDDTLTTLMSLFNRYNSLVQFADEGIFNLYFHKQWIKLPVVFGLNVTRYTTGKINYNKKKVHGIVLHFIGTSSNDHYKPWHPDCPFYSEWLINCDKAESMDLKRPQKVRRWNSQKILYYSLLMKYYYEKAKSTNRLKQIFYFIKDKIIDRIKLFFIHKIFNNLKLFYFCILNTPERVVGKIGAFLKTFFPGLYNKLKRKKSQF